MQYSQRSASNFCHDFRGASSSFPPVLPASLHLLCTHKKATHICLTWTECGGQLCAGLGAWQQQPALFTCCLVRSQTKPNNLRQEHLLPLQQCCFFFSQHRHFAPVALFFCSASCSCCCCCSCCLYWCCCLWLSKQQQQLLPSSPAASCPRLARHHRHNNEKIVSIMFVFSCFNLLSNIIKCRNLIQPAPFLAPLPVPVPVQAHKNRIRAAAQQQPLNESKDSSNKGDGAHSANSRAQSI